jgi:molybdenum cofactor cytidylyltransferase
MAITEKPYTTVGVILLAAGQSRRFGGDKRLAEITLNTSVSTSAKSSRTVLFQTVSQICESGLPLFVVLRPGDQAIGQQLDQLGIDWGICPDAALGMGHSLAFGVHSNQHWHGWLIALADMPWIQPHTYRQVAEVIADSAAQQNAGLIARPQLIQEPLAREPQTINLTSPTNLRSPANPPSPAAQHSIASRPRYGHPVGFSRAFGWQLMQCQGDHGARHLMQRHQDVIYPVSVSDAGILRDIDTRTDLER